MIIVIVIMLAMLAACNVTDGASNNGGSTPTPNPSESALDFPRAIAVTDGALTWKEVEGATNYAVFDGDKILAENVAENHYDLSALSDGVHCLSVVAKNTETTSAKSVFKYYVSDRLSKRVSAGAVHTLFIDCYGNLWGVGDNSFGQLGINGTYTENPTKLVEGVQFKQVAAGGDFSLALDVDGNLWSWGNNAFGQLATGDTTSVSAPQKSPLDLKYSYISVGNSYALAIDLDDYVWCWGNNAEGKLGCGDRKDKKVPVRAKLAVKATMVAAGYSHSVALDVDGNLWGWGNNFSGQLGDVNFVESGVVTPQKISVENKIATVSAALNKTLALDENGKLYYFGQNDSFDEQLNKDDAYVCISAGNNGFALVKNGRNTVVVWDGETVKEFDADRAINIAAGGDHYIYTSVENEFYTFGNNVSGQLGYSGEYSYFKKINM